MLFVENLGNVEKQVTYESTTKRHFGRLPLTIFPMECGYLGIF